MWINIAWACEYMCVLDLISSCYFSLEMFFFSQRASENIDVLYSIPSSTLTETLQINTLRRELLFSIMRFFSSLALALVSVSWCFSHFMPSFCTLCLYMGFLLFSAIWRSFASQLFSSSPLLLCFLAAVLCFHFYYIITHFHINTIYTFYNME